MFRGRYIRLFLMWADKPLTHYQIVDLEDIVSLLMYRIKLIGIVGIEPHPTRRICLAEGGVCRIVIFVVVFVST